MFLQPLALRGLYSVIGRFYRIGYESQLEVCCRGTIEIFNSQLDIQSRDPDAYVVMENPGSSCSLEISGGHIDGPLYLTSDCNLAELIRHTPLTMAKPDRTQYQIMRLMNWYRWNYVRVLNLSDIRNTNSQNLILEYEELNDPYLSIFSDHRDKERAHFLNDIENKPVVVAWGINSGLEELANRALSKLPDHVRGLPGKQPYMFLHPWPRRGGGPCNWLKRFIQEIRF